MSLDPVVNPKAARFIPVAKPSLDWLDRVAVASVVDSGWISQGPVTAEFETEFAKAHGCTYGVAVNSGTSALCLALAAAKIGPGDKVVIPSLTMIAVGNAVLYRGATPVFVDSEPESGNADPSWVDRIHSQIGIPQAVIVVHTYGIPAASFMQEAFGGNHGKWKTTTVIEDCCESHYAEYEFDGARCKVGAIGNMGCFSFYSNKIIAAGEGGMVTVGYPGDDNQCRLVDRLRSLRSHCFTPGRHFQHDELAYGMRICDLQSAIGLAQHRKRDELLAARKQVADWYDERLMAHCGWLSFPPRPKGSVSWVYSIVCRSGDERDKLRHRLAEAGVDSRTFFIPMHQQKHLRQFSTDSYPVADRLSETGLYLPLYPLLSEDDVDYICEVVRKN